MCKVLLCNKRVMHMSVKLQQLFDLQHFAGNSRLQALIDDTMSRYGSMREELSVDELELNAAGDHHTKYENDFNSILNNGENK